jgi:multicomponent Na+:H+ antiporter subunit F
MSVFFAALGFFLLVTNLAGLVRVGLGPEPADRMLAAQLMGSTGVAILLLLAQVTDEAALRNVALLFALLAVLTAVAFVERPARRSERDQ